MSWGYHLIGNFGKCSPSKIRSAQNILNFSSALVDRIYMVPYGNAHLVHFGTGNKAGYTLVQLIETSNICAHFVEETNDVYLDVFSCKGFDKDAVREVFGKFFNHETEEVLFLKRQAPLKNEHSLSEKEMR
jgi:S-adenosylmethionine/arginine decarboxylase-like enzyme